MSSTSLSPRPSPFHLPLLSLLPLILVLLLLPSSSLSADCPVEHTPLTLIQFEMSHPATQAVHHQSIKMTPIEATLTKLAEIKGRVAVISIAGAYRTGKSFFLNQLLPPMMGGHSSSGGRFQVGDTVEAETQEVQVHVIPGCALQSFGLQDQSITVLFMDTPGLYSPDRLNVFDSQLLALLNLLSSVILYNQGSVVGRADIDQLNQAMETAFLLSFFSSKEGEGAASATRGDLDRPHLLWMFQSLHLNMTTSVREYLMRKLNQTDQGRAGEHSYFERFNRFFASIDAESFPYPSEHTVDLSRLQSLTWEELTPEYRKAVTDFRPRAISRAYVKKVAGADMTGELLVDMVKTWIEIMAVRVADLTEQNTEVLFREIIKKQVDSAKAAYQQQMSAVSLPLSRTKLQEKSDAVKQGLAKGKEGISRFIADFNEAVATAFGAYKTQNQGLLDKEGGKVKEVAKTVLAFGKAEIVRMKGPSGVYTAQQITDLERQMEDKWAKGVAALNEAAQSLAEELKAEWTQPWAKVRDSSKAGNSATSLQQCLQRAQLVHTYYQTRSPFFSWQTEAEYYAVMEAMQNSRESVPSYILQGGPSVECVGEGKDNADVQDLYKDTTRVYLQTHRIQMAVVTFTQIGLLILTAFAATKASIYFNALGGGTLRAREVDAKEGYNAYIMMGGAAVAALVGYSGVDGVWSSWLAWLMALVLAAAGGLGVRLRMKTVEQLTKDQQEMRAC